MELARTSRRQQELERAAYKVAKNNRNRGAAGIIYDCSKRGVNVSTKEAFGALLKAEALIAKQTSGK